MSNLHKPPGFLKKTAGSGWGGRGSGWFFVFFLTCDLFLGFYISKKYFVKGPNHVPLPSGVLAVVGDRGVKWTFCLEVYMWALEVCY